MQNNDNLWENEERFRKIFECGAVGIVLCTVDHRFKDVNSKFCQMIGYSKKELRLMTYMDITHPFDIESSKALKLKLHTGQISRFNVDKRYLPKDGSVLWGATTVSMVRAQDDTPMYTVAVIENITKQKQLEIENRKLQEKLNKSRKMKALDDYRGRGQKILIVDNEKNQRDLLSNILTKLEYQPQAFESGEEAVEYLKKNKAELIILDMILETGMDSQETYKKIREMNPDQRAILASDFAENGDTKKTPVLGTNRLIKKPYSLKKIGPVVKDTLT